LEAGVEYVSRPALPHRGPPTFRKECCALISEEGDLLKEFAEDTYKTKHAEGN